jgi:trimethylamine--corrinoid protein Co-methyltransferase
LSQLVVIQLKKPGAPVIFGSIPTIIDMKTAICSYGNPETAFLVAAMADLGHSYGLPVFGRAGAVDSDVIDSQASIEATYQILLSAFSGAALRFFRGRFHPWTRRDERGPDGLA